MPRTRAFEQRLQRQSVAAIGERDDDERRMHAVDDLGERVARTEPPSVVRRPRLGHLIVDRARDDVARVCARLDLLDQRRGQRAGAENQDATRLVAHVTKFAYHEVLMRTCPRPSWLTSLLREVVLVVRVVVAEHRLRVAVEHDAEHLGRIEQVQRFAEQLPRRLVGGDDHEDTVDGVGEQRRVEHRQQRRRVEHDEVVALARFREHDLEARRSQDVMHRRASRTPAG